LREKILLSHAKTQRTLRNHKEEAKREIITLF